jgi:transposase
MARALSQDLRCRVIAAVDAGLSRRAAAERFGVGIATAIRWLHAWHSEGRAAAMAMGGDLRSQRIEAYCDVILDAIDAEVDITLVELSAMLRREHGASFAPSTVWRFLDRHGMTFKKNCARQRAAPPRRGSASAGLVRRAA